MNEFDFFKKINPEIKKITSEEYDAFPAIRSSSLQPMLKSPMHFRYKLSASYEETKSLINGRMLHMAILEKDLFLDSFVVMPDFGDLRSKANKEAKKNWCDQRVGKTFLTQDMFDAVSGMATSISLNEDAMSFLKDGFAETGFFCNDPLTGIALKSKPDFIHANYLTMIDVKTTRDISDWSFANSIKNYGYAFQFGFYIEVVKIITGVDVRFPVIIAVENEPPYDCQPFLLDDETVDYGRSQFRKSINKLKHCMDLLASGKNPFINNNKIKSIGLPHYILEQGKINEQ